MRLFTKGIALAVLLAVPSVAIAAGTDTTVKSGGVGPNTQYLGSTTKVTMTVDSACSSLSASDVDLGTSNGTASTPNGTAYSNNFNVLTTCTNPHGAFLSFQSPTFNQSTNTCELTSGSNMIPYVLTYNAQGTNDARAAGTNYCGAPGSDTNTAYRFPLADTETNGNFIFTATATPALGQVAGSYSDTVSVYLEF